MKHCNDCGSKYKPFVHNATRCNNCQDSYEIRTGQLSRNKSKSKTKNCRYCGNTFNMTGPASIYCSNDCRKHYKRAVYYNLKVEEYKEIIKVNCCDICGGDSFGLSMHLDAQWLCIDHDGTNGAVRGLLCHNCNRGLGLFQHSVERLLEAAEYLERAETIPGGSRGKRPEARGTQQE